ncbi:MAG: hypothetical protein N4A71_22050 [Carboxylicivirga sp.]|jgi:hypothetical protein|nr:hypothetical protein [Carboxylicivirga sp.]
MILTNQYIPFKGFAAMAVWPVIFVRKGAKFTRATETHECIHFAQQKELLLVGFYLLYLIFWLRYGYKNIPFEREAKSNENKAYYLMIRKPFAWLKYFK